MGLLLPFHPAQPQPHHQRRIHPPPPQRFPLPAAARPPRVHLVRSPSARELAARASLARAAAVEVDKEARAALATAAVVVVEDEEEEDALRRCQEAVRRLWAARERDVLRGELEAAVAGHRARLVAALAGRRSAEAAEAEEWDAAEADMGEVRVARAEVSRQGEGDPAVEARVATFGGGKSNF